MKELKRIKGSKLENEIKSVIEQHERFKNSYFWSSPSSASSRRAYEAQNSRKPIIFKYKDQIIKIKQEVSCSCKNVYYSFSVHVNDCKKNISFLKKLIK